MAKKIDTKRSNVDRMVLPKLSKEEKNALEFRRELKELADFHGKQTNLFMETKYMKEHAYLLFFILLTAIPLLTWNSDTPKVYGINDLIFVLVILIGGIIMFIPLVISYKEFERQSEEVHRVFRENDLKIEARKRREVMKQ